MAANRTRLVVLVALLCAGCATTSVPATPQDQFFDRLLALCGQQLEGRIVSPPVAADADFAGKRLVAHVRDCSPTEMRIPFHVGEDRSRTWIVTRSSTGLRLKHDHRHEDGAEDKISQYGGDTVTMGSDQRQEFPADQFTRELLVREGNAAGASNAWALEAGKPSYLAYELRRPGRFFRVEFGSPPRSKVALTLLAPIAGRAYIAFLSSTSSLMLRLVPSRGPVRDLFVRNAWPTPLRSPD